MRHVFLTAISLMAVLSMTVRDQMTTLHEIFGVNFVYDSSLSLDMKYEGRPMSSLAKEGAGLEKCLETLFDGTGIDFEINRKYVVLTRKDSRRKPKDYTIFIEEQHDTLNESRITAFVDHRQNATQTGMKKLEGRDFRANAAPLAQPDVIKTLQALPGVASGVEMLSGLYVHGGTGNDNLFLLDGVPIHQVSHLAGLFSSFNTEVIDALDFYKSGFPARYGGRLSSVVDVTTREGDMQEYHGMFSVGLINGSLQFEGPIVKGRTSFNVAMRRSWLDVFSVPVLAILNKRNFLPAKEIGARYAMTDLNASITHIFSEDSRLSANFYTGRDILKVDYDDYSVEYWEGERFTGSGGWYIDVAWGNTLASLNWKYRISDALHMNAIAYYSGSNSKVGYGTHSWDFERKEITEISAVERNSSLLHNIGAKADFDWKSSERHHVRFGADVKQDIFRPSRSMTNGISVTGRQSESETDAVGFRYYGTELGLYCEDEISVGKWFKTNVGLRYNLFGVKGKAYHALEPRLAMRFQCGPSAAVKLSYTEMNQFAHEVRTMFLDLPLTLWMPSTAKVAPMKSRQLAAGLFLDLPYNLTLNLEGYYKTMDNIMEYMGVSQFYPPLDDWEKSYVSGEGRAYGMEAECAYRTAKTEVSACYTLSWNMRRFEEFYQGWYPDRYDNRHRLTISANHRFTDRFDIYASWNWHSGNKVTVLSHSLEPVEPESSWYTESSMTPEDFYDRPNNMSLPDYHRLDVGMNFRKTTRRGNESIWTLSVYNVYCRMNPIWADIETSEKYENGYTCWAYGIVPVIPMFSYTLRF